MLCSHDRRDRATRTSPEIASIDPETTAISTNVPRSPRRAGDVAVERANDLQHSPHVPLLPVPLRAVRVRVVAMNAARLHPPRRRIAQRRVTRNDSKR